MNKLLFLIFCSLTAVSSEYKFSFEKVETDFSSDLLTLIPDSSNWKYYGSRKSFESFSNAPQSDHEFDLINKTAACILKTEDKKYKTLFFGSSSVLPVCIDEEKPLIVQITKNIIFKINHNKEIFFIEIPSNIFGYYNNSDLKEIKVTFDEDKEEIIQELLEGKYFCHASKCYGKFYLKNDDKKMTYLLTIEKQNKSMWTTSDSQRSMIEKIFCFIGVCFFLIVAKKSLSKLFSRFV